MSNEDRSPEFQSITDATKVVNSTVATFNSFPHVYYISQVLVKYSKHVI